MPLQDLSTSRLTIDRRRAEFADPACEARFLQHCLPERNAQLKTSLLCAAGFYVVFGATDIATLGPTGIAFALIALRVAVALVALGGYLAICRWPESVATSTGASSALLVVALAVFMVVCWYQPGTLPWNVMSQALIVMAVYVNFPNRLGYTVAIGAGSSAVFGAMQVVQGYLKTDDVLTLVLLLILSNVLGYLAARRLHLSQREQFCATILLRQMADRDPLTGCHNRRVLQQGLLAAELARARRYGTALSVILCDIDHFKRINDTHGHAAGDQVLASFAGLLQAMTRETVDSVVRYGGEEFLVVLPQTELAAGAGAGRTHPCHLRQRAMPHRRRRRRQRDGQFRRRLRARRAGGVAAIGRRADLGRGRAAVCRQTRWPQRRAGHLPVSPAGAGALRYLSFSSTRALRAAAFPFPCSSHIQQRA
ncbi:GGDEF domain-containing protein [Pseudoduganella sp. SL102]|uniref:GGDEF domain-containing protein n=1 Tax=Pseudoduganella sp. SL102 TaxID=2995154 RepID=UPI00248BB05B|nr:GGDEF domain-containing protein [Pseudoduganella sp. SL102]WBS00440.1 GGDEF domain-containing protein [Pseudoduganella sp. SL102]